MSDHLTAASGLSRRDLLRRSAALGAAVAVATPAVQVVGQVAAFAQVSPPPEETSFPSHIQLIFTVEGADAYYGIKWDGSWGRIGGPPEGPGSRCWDHTTYRDVGYEDASSDQMAIFGSKASVTTEVHPDDPARGGYVLDPSGLRAVGVQIVDAATFDGAASGGYSGKCALPITPDDDGRYRFWKP